MIKAVIYNLIDIALLSLIDCSGVPKFHSPCINEPGFMVNVNTTACSHHL